MFKAKGQLPRAHTLEWRHHLVFSTIMEFWIISLEPSNRRVDAT